MSQWLSWFPPELQVFILSGMPFVELRGAIPYAAVLGLPYYKAFFITLIGNLLPIIPLLYFFDPLMKRLYERSPRYQRFFERIQQNAVKKSDSIRKHGASLGLFLFVAIPLPGTGAYSACFAAAFFRIPFWKAVRAISLGTLFSGTLFTILIYYLKSWFF